MAKYLTTDKLIESVKRRAAIPENQQTFLEDDFLAFANEEMDMAIIPHILTNHEEYFVYTEKIPLDPDTNRYQIPTRAVANKLRELAYEDQNGNIFEMTRIKIDDLPTYQNNYSTNLYNMFYVEGTDIVLVPIISSGITGYLRFSYYLRPNEIVSEDRVSVITDINRITGEIRVNQTPSNIMVSDSLDLVQTKSPHKTLALDVMCMGINTTTNTYTFDPDDIPAALAVGDQIALAGETIVPQIPTDLHSMLAQRIAARCLESLGDIQGLSAANTKLAEMEDRTSSVLSNRVEGAPLKVVNRHSVLKTRRIYWRF